MAATNYRTGRQQKYRLSRILLSLALFALLAGAGCGGEEQVPEEDVDRKKEPGPAKETGSS